MDRRARTRKLIELGGMVQKSGLVAATNDDRTLILGALLVIARNLEGPGSQEKRERWRVTGKESLIDNSVSRWREV